MLRRAICLALCLLTLPALCFADSAFTMAGYDGEESTHDWSTNQFFTRMSENTGVSFTYNEFNSFEKYQAAKKSMFESNELPDVFFKASFTTPELIKYTESGHLIDLKPLLADNAPNLWAVLSANPDWLKAITLPSGKIGALPGLTPQGSQNILWINKKWLDNLKLEVPTDWQSFKAVLAAFKTGDPNGNGKADEKPLSYLGTWDLKFLSHAFGVVANDYNVYINDAGKVCYWPLEDSFVTLVSELRELYADGLMDKDGFQTADTLRRLTDDNATVTYGAFFSPTPVNLLTFKQSADYIALEPLTFGGARVYRDMGLDVTRGAFAITSECDDPAAVLKWVDTLYTEAGATEAMVGREGDVYIELENGYWNWKGGIESLQSGMLDELSIYDTGEMPWLFPQSFYERYEDEDVRRIYAELDKYSAYVKSPFPVYTLSDEQSAELMPLQNTLGLYVDETFAKLVLGQTELNEQSIADFRAGLYERGVEQMVALWQSVADAQ